MFKRLKLFHKFVLVMVILVVVPLLIQGIKMISISRTALQRGILETHTHLARNIACDIDDYIAGLNLDLAFILTFERFPQDTSWAKKMKFLLSVLSVHEDFILIALLDEKGDKIIHAHNPNFKMASLKKSHPEVNQNIKQIFKKVKATGHVQLGSIYYFEEDPRIDIIYPLKSIKQFVFISTSLGNLWRKIKAVKIGKTGFAFLVDKEGRIIFHPDLNRAKGFENVSHFSIVHELLKEKNGWDSKEFVDGSGAEMVGAYAKVASLNWGVVMQQPKKEAYSSVRRMKISASFWVLISILVSIFAAFYLAKNMSRPISELTVGVEKLGQGNLDCEVKVKTGDELSTLANTFNLMTKRLKEFQEKLIQSERLAAVGKMASVVGHEIRNPLSAINNAVYYIKSKIGTLDPKVSKHFGIIEREIVATNKIAGDLLGFSRTREPVLQLSNLNAIIEEILDNFSSREDVKMEKDLANALPQVKVDIDEIRQVFLNLISNAFQAMHNSGTLRISTRRRNDGHSVMNKSGNTVSHIHHPKSVVEVSISDTGCGISQENLDKLFEPFFSTKSGGTGLGLAVVHKIVSRHKGTIEVKSKVGSGTTFIIALPIS